MHHEPESTSCTTPGCGYILKRIGEDVSEKLDYTPGLFTVERHIRGKWACAHCQSLTQAPVPAQIRPTAIGRGNWLFAGSLRAGQRAAAVMSLIQSAKLNGHDPCTYMKDVLSRLPTQRASQVGELLPHRWQTTFTVA